jgi:hypothetical protein
MISVMARYPDFSSPRGRTNATLDVPANSPVKVTESLHGETKVPTFKSHDYFDNPLPGFHCPICDGDYEAGHQRTGAYTSYCSPACYMRMLRGVDDRNGDECEMCDTSMKGRRSDAKYCSSNCRVAARRLRDAHDR